MEQLLNEIRIAYIDSGINQILAGIPEGNTNAPYSMRFNQAEEYFIELGSPLLVPHLPIHHDIRTPIPAADYAAAIRDVVSQLAAVLPECFSGLTYFFDPAEILKPCFYRLYKLNLLRKVSAPTSLLVENAVLFDRTKILAITDSLTQLYNRRHFEQRLNTIIFDAEKQGKKVSLCIADVDFFKFYNDTNGHQAGDVVLKKIAEVLKQGVKGSDVVGRYGGEEFIIIFPDTDKNSAVRICNTIRKKIKDYKFHNEENQPQNDLTISFGVASYPDDAKTPEQLIKQADFSLYRAKEAGKDRVIS